MPHLMDACGRTRVLYACGIRMQCYVCLCVHKHCDVGEQTKMLATRERTHTSKRLSQPNSMLYAALYHYKYIRMRVCVSILMCVHVFRSLK